MHTVHLFNPENDIALATNVSNFTAPINAARIAYDLSVLPYFIAGENDYVLVQNDSQVEWINQLEKKFHRCVVGITPHLNGIDISNVSPWGWSKAIKHRLATYGIGAEIMPSEADLEKIRWCANRERTVYIIQEMLKENPITSGTTIPCVCKNIRQILDFTKQYPNTILKSPWSSSGRGIIATAGVCCKQIISRGQGIINHQKSILAEPYYNKLLDFAMEFYVCENDNIGDTERVCCKGYSVFVNDARNSFDYGLVASDDRLEQIILEKSERNVTRQDLEQLKESLCRIIGSVFGGCYKGYVGVDMMICKNNDGKIFINPCVEMNVRCTMGVVAHEVYCRMREASLIGENEVKKFIVRYYRTGEDVKKACNEIVAHGGMVLNHIDEETRFLACVV